MTGNLAGLASECGTLTTLSAKPGEDKIIAGVARKGLWATSDGGKTWSALGTGAGSASIDNRPSVVVYDPVDSNSFWVAGIYGAGIYRTTDGGNKFVRLGNIEHNDFVSVDFTDAARQLLLAGGHEQAQKVYKSTNGGESWSEIGVNLPSGTNFSSDPIVIDAQTYIVNSAQSWGGGSLGIYRTVNGGSSWTKVSDLGPVKDPINAANGHIYWSTGEGIARSKDQGATWAKVGSGLKQEVAPILLPDGRLAAVGKKTLMVSADEGDTWTSFGSDLPFGDAAGVIYAAQEKVFYIWRWECTNAVPANAIAKLTSAAAP